MDWKDILEILGIFTLSAVKFGIAGVPAAVFAQYSFFKTITITVSGGIAGAIFFTFLSEWLIKKSKQIIAKKITPQKVKKKFTKTNKIIVLVKTKFGLTGISIITPLFLSMPLGVFLAVRYFHNKQKIISYMSVSILCWAIILYFFYHFFYSRLSHLF